MEIRCDFQPRQIVCLEHRDSCLYAEVIQVVESRQVGWIRPLLLVECAFENPANYDLRAIADLLWPIALFRPALDTEVMPLLVQLLASEPPLDRDPVAFTQLHQFIHQVWQSQK